MNILHLRYAIEVERTLSISKAAENLFMNQSNLSRSIRELEQSLGITIFRRTSKGMTPTAQGEDFLRHAKRIVAEIDEVEALYKNGGDGKTRFSVSVPRASYISAAFADFAAELPDGPADVYYKETNSLRAINNLLQSNYRLGIIRYQKTFESYFKAMLHEKDLLCEPIADYSCRLLIRANDPLASRQDITLADLADYTEIGNPDHYVPSLPFTDVIKAETSEVVTRRIYVFERASQFDILSKVPKTFMWVSSIPADLLEKYNLVQISCSANEKVYRDLLIYRKGYHFTPLDRRFIELVHAHKAMLDLCEE
ncbi:MAG: LysR family transcriptional regulator [Clostridia bacterium]|nr:LysR family transcriptional regulator [Clostridia bacterium]